jgi:ABC-2 type transport system permease protein
VKTALPTASVYEWRRALAARSTTWVLGLILVVGIVLGLQGLSSGDSGAFLAGAAGHVGQVGVLAAVLGALAIGPEFRWNTIRALFITFPRRYDIFAAKIVVVAFLVAAASLVASVVGGAMGYVHRGPDDSVLGWLGLSVRGALVLVCWAAIGFALAALFRSTIVGIAIPVAVAFLVETILIQSTQSETVAALLPFYNAAESVSVQVATGEAYEHLAVFAGWALLFLGLSALVVGRRDA